MSCENKPWICLECEMIVKTGHPFDGPCPVHPNHKKRILWRDEPDRFDTARLLERARKVRHTDGQEVTNDTP